MTIWVYGTTIGRWGDSGTMLLWGHTGIMGLWDHGDMGPAWGDGAMGLWAYAIMGLWGGSGAMGLAECIEEFVAMLFGMYTTVAPCLQSLSVSCAIGPMAFVLRPVAWLSTA